ncbi:MAG: cytochrome c [Bacteroidetes bacterium]|nr:cytochrome c [Bacteroidota bacterium]
MKYLVALSLLFAVVGCRDSRKPGIEYAPQMYTSIPYEPYSQVAYNANTKDGRNVMMPVAGTVARGKEAYYYPYPATDEGYQAAGTELKNPLEPTAEVLAAGKKLYNVQCVHCHGEKGDGQGTLNTSKSYEGIVPDYKVRLPTINAGKAFHTITHGKGAMGAHAYALSPAERWQLVTYIYSLIADAPPAQAGAPAAAAEEKK